MNPLTSARRLADRTLRIQESATLAMAAEARRIAATGIRVISLTTGEPDFPTPEVIKQGAFEAINENFTKYTAAEGILPLREAVAEKFSRDNRIKTSAERVLVSAGGKHALYNILLAIAQEGDEVVVPAPYWTSYPDMVRLVGAEPVILRSSRETGYKFTPDQLEQAITPQTRAMLLNSPSNPSGVMYTPDEIRAIGKIAAKHGIYVISDELYEKIIYDNNVHLSPGSLPELADLGVTINGVSKAYAMTGWRIGYVTGPADVIAAASRLQSQTTSNACSISQRAALVALRDGGNASSEMVKVFATRRENACRLFGAIPDVFFPRPDGAFYLFIDVSAYRCKDAPDSASLAMRLLANHGVAVVPGSGFGDDSAIRISFACSDSDLEEGASRLAEGLSALRR